MTLHFRPAVPADIPACVQMRGRTRENAVSPERLAEMGITVDSWSGDVASILLKVDLDMLTGRERFMSGTCPRALELLNALCEGTAQRSR